MKVHTFLVGDNNFHTVPNNFQIGGLDISEFKTLDDSKFEFYKKWLNGMQNIKKPTIASINGYAVSNLLDF